MYNIQKKTIFVLEAAEPLELAIEVLKIEKRVIYHFKDYKLTFSKSLALSFEHTLSARFLTHFPSFFRLSHLAFGFLAWKVEYLRNYLKFRKIIYCKVVEEF